MIHNAVAAGAIGLFVVAILAWSSISKLRNARLPQATFPLLPSLVRNERVIVLVVVAIEILVATGILLFPLYGLLTAFLLFGVYTLVTLGIPDGTPCYCFGSDLEFGNRRAGRLIRNVVLGLTALWGAIASAGVRPEWSLAAALGGFAGVLSLLAVDAFVGSLAGTPATRSEGVNVNVLHQPE